MEQPDLIVVHIETLVAHGADPSTAAGLGAALETELTRLISDGGVPAALGAGRDLPALVLPDQTGSADADAATSGRRIAVALYRELGGTPPAPGGAAP